MKNLLFIMILFTPALFAQESILFSVNPGMSLYHSENSMKMIGDKEIKWFGGLAVGYENEDLWGMHIRLEYNYNIASIPDVKRYFIYDPLGSGPIDTAGIDMTFETSNFDGAVCRRLGEWLKFSIGPAVSIVRRSIITDKFAGPLESHDGLEDRLVSVCIGVNISANAEFPFTDDPNYLYFFSGFKLRYLHSLWFDDRGRKLDNYYQSFLTGQLVIGLGYVFN